MAYTYDRNVDYAKEIQKDVAAQDWRSAALHEAQRNAKIANEPDGKAYTPTSHFTDYLPEGGTGGQQTARGTGAAVGGIQSRQWEYNPEQDPALQAYRKEYLREADRQTRDTLGYYAGQTGGVPSTAAVAAAQQAGNYQRALYADKIPELMQADWERDNTEQQQAIANAMSQWTTLGYADAYVASILGVPEGTSTMDASYSQWQRSMAEQQWAWQQESDRWQRAQTENESAYNRAMIQIQLGVMPSNRELTAAGISRSAAQRMVNRYLQQLLSSGSGRSSGGSRSSGAGSSGRSGSGSGNGSGSGKGSEEESASESGPNTEDEVNSTYKELLKAVNGYDPSRGHPAAQMQKLVNRITAAYTGGKITEVQANELLKRIGYTGYEGGNNHAPV